MKRRLFDLPLPGPPHSGTGFDCLIGVAILFISRDAAKTIWYRLMDAIEPEILAEAETVLARQTKVKELRRLRMRWVGHRLQAELYIAVSSELSIVEGHQVAEEVRHALFHQMGNLSEVVVHVDPWSASLDSYHSLTNQHEGIPQNR